MGTTAGEIAIAELARLMLELSPVTIVLNSGEQHARWESELFWNHANSRMLEINEIAPSLVINVEPPQYMGGTAQHLAFYKDAKLIAVVGDYMPKSLEVIWIPVESKRFSELLYANLLQFAEAGYPGCVGCLGPAFDRNWNERAHRESLRP
ncbi:MAG TPA: hypothetical protein QF424_00825 [Candidatus Thalassarchaeaceae archaeon]|jgi:hypothetical protein|nr:hypothetical protein [Candidatus Thalassarchaeaceae archaeon]|tara:strand:- start:13023 stop:13475 length:453 start_codon:yes stop_codon:yes gene_type:complete